MERREHDLFMDMASNPWATFDNLVVAGLNSKNTSLLDRSAYENDDWVKEQFKDVNGDFDRLSFNRFYDNAKIYYNHLSNSNFDESMNRLVSYHRDNIFAPVELKRLGPEYNEILMSNPFLTSYGIIELGKAGSRTKSMDELAQANKVLLNPTTAGDNLEHALWGDSPNDNFFGYFPTTLVLAQYDSDGTHTDLFTGETVEHKAGDLKLDNSGNFYYEKLDGRDIYGRRVLNKMNVLTTDGSWANQFDFFDSDDLLQKSIGGTVLKNLALVGSMFIPYVGPWVAGISIATLLAGLMGTLGKMANGSDSPVFSELEGWSKSVSRLGATSEYAQEHTWCWENFINLIGDVAGQLKEQRFIFEKIPTVFKGANMMSKEGLAAKLAEFEKLRLKSVNTQIKNLRKSGISEEKILLADANLRTVAALKAQGDLNSFVKGYNKLGEILSKGYMTAITVGDTYGEAKLAGASDLEATLLTLGYAAGEYALLNTGLGEWIMPELRAGRYKMEAITKKLMELSKESLELFKLFGSTLKNMPKEGKKEYAKKLFNIGKNIAKAEYSKGIRSLSATAASAAGEGFEEVSEELLADFSKSCYNTVKWLQGDDTRIDAFGFNFKTNTWDGKEVLDRYGMSLVGGAVGGGLTNAFTNYKMINSLEEMTSKQAMEELIHIIRNGESKDLIKTVKKMTLADPNFSTDYTIDGSDIVFEPGTKENNQDIYAKLAFINLVNILESILLANGAIGDNAFLDTQTLNDLRFYALLKSTTAGAYLQEYNSLLRDIAKLTKDINGLVKSVADTNNDNTVTDREARKAKLSETDRIIVDKFEKELKEKKLKLDDLISGKRAYEFIATSLFEMTTALSSKFTLPTFPLYALRMYGKKFSELTENDKEYARQKYGLWKTTDARELLRVMSDIYLLIAELASKVIELHGNDYLLTSDELNDLNTFISRLNEINTAKDEDDWLKRALEAVDSSIPNLGVRLIKILGTELDIADINLIISRRPSEDATENEIKEFKNQVLKDFIRKTDEVLLNNIESFISPFILKGFANTETRNLLRNLLLYALDVIKRKSVAWDNWALENYFESIGKINPYIETQNTIFNLIKLVEDLNNTPLELNLNEFSISIGLTPINISELILKLNDSFNDVSDNITKFNLDELLYKELKNAIFTLELYQAAILGARTDSANLDDLFGFNATLNEVAGKIKGSEYPKLAEISSLIADIFVEDININLNKLRFLQQLYEINLGQKLSKLDRVSTRKDLLIYKRLRNIVLVPDDDELKTWNGFLELLTIINGMVLHDKYLQSGENVINDKDREAFETEKINVENAIYDFFLKNQNKLNNVLELAKFLSPKRLLLYTEAKELLNEGLENLDDNSIVWWIASRVAVRSLDFYNLYKQIIDTNAEKPLAPIATLELAVYNNYASVVNGNVFTAFYNAYRYAITEDWKNRTIEERKELLKLIGKSTETDKENPISEVDLLAADNLVPYSLNFLPKPRYSNIVLTEGIPGSGN